MRMERTIPGNMRMRRRKQRMFQKSLKKYQRKYQKKMEVLKQKIKLKRFKEDGKESRLRHLSHREGEKESQLKIQNLLPDLGNLTGTISWNR